MGKLRKKIQKCCENIGMRTQMSAYILLLAFVLVILIILYLWQYSSTSFSDIIQKSSLESYWTKIKQVEYYTDNFLQVFDDISEDDRLEECVKNDNNPSLTAWWLNRIMNDHLSGYRADLVAIYLVTEKDREYLFYYWPEMYYMSLRGEAKKKYGKLKAIAQNTDAGQGFYTQVCEFRGIPCTAVAKTLQDEKKNTYTRMIFLMKNETLQDFTGGALGEEFLWGFRITAGENLLCESINYEELQNKYKTETRKIRRVNWNFSCAVDTGKVQKEALQKFSGALVITMAIYVLVVFLLMHAINGQLKRQEKIIRRQNEKNIRILEQQKIAELKALELEINPHYLYNTLNSINGMAIEHQDYEVSRMLKIFSSNLVYILKERYRPVPLQKELQWLEEYLQLQKYRFMEKFDYEIDAEPGMEELLIYKLLLQPFLENAILHGFSGMESGGMLTILLYREEEKIHIRICDNGQGIEREKLLQIQKIVEDPTAEAQTGLGILNSCRRMQGYYGKEGAVRIESIAGEGTAVEIILPLIEKEDAR